MPSELRRVWPQFLVGLLTLAGLLVSGLAHAQGAPEESPSFAPRPGAFHPQRVLIKFRGGSPTAMHASFGAQVIREFRGLNRIQLVELPALRSVADALQYYRGQPDVEFVEPDYQVHGTGTFPNDPYFYFAPGPNPSLDRGPQWGLHNVDAASVGWSVDEDIDAPEAWEIRSSAPQVIVAVIDSGVNYTHEDLAPNMWVNPREIPSNGIDDDGNGYIDDIHGIDAINNGVSGGGPTGSVPAGDPRDLFGHGTHVAGIIAARGNNGTGISGVAWHAQIMALRFIDASNSGFVSDAIECVLYAVKMGAQVINNSYGWVPTDADVGGILAFKEAVSYARNHGVLFVAAAGNNGTNNDTIPFYPANLDLDNVVSVAAQSPFRQLAPFSNLGKSSVHLAAPGSGIFSTLNEQDYVAFSGTSMASPFVAGAFTLLRAEFPFDSHFALINRMLNGVDPIPLLIDKVQTGGRLNLHRALTGANTRPINDDFSRALEITTAVSPASVTVIGNNVGATRELGEPTHAGKPGGSSIWWKWKAPGASSVRILTAGSGVDTRIGVYTGPDVAHLSGVGNDDGGQASTSQVVINTPTKNRTYYIAVDGKDGAQGAIRLSVEYSTAAQPRTLRLMSETLRITSTGSHARFRVSGPANATVYIQSSTDLQNWISIPGISSVSLDGVGLSTTLADALGSATQKFYRVQTSDQQCANVLGVIKRVVPAGKSLHCNALLSTNNTISTLFSQVLVNGSLAKPPTGTVLSLWNDISQRWSNITFGASWNNPNLLLLPGSSFLIQSPSPFTKVWLGEVPTGYTQKSLPSRLNLVTAPLPLAGRLVRDLRFIPSDGDSILTLLNGSYSTYSYQDGMWRLGDTVASEPTIAAGEAFFCLKSTPGAWNRNYLIWP